MKKIDFNFKQIVKDPKAFYQKNQKLVIGAGIGLLVIIALWYVFISDPTRQAESDLISQNFEKAQETNDKSASSANTNNSATNNSETDANGAIGIDRDKINQLKNSNNPFASSDSNSTNSSETNTLDAISSNVNNPFNSVDMDSVLNKDSSNEPKIADISDQTNARLRQEEAMRAIERSQKPNDMIAYLKSIQKDIDFRGGTLPYFKFEDKEYNVGEKLRGWYLIEKIDTNFIRFKDDDYAYNLRFIKE